MEVSNLNQALAYLNGNTINVMQILVLQEVDRQFKELPVNKVQYIKLVEVATYALNRLPPLYASSQEGMNYQLKQAKQDYKDKITVAVRQGFAAVQRDPLRRSTPLKHKKPQETPKNQPSTGVESNNVKTQTQVKKTDQTLPDLYSKYTHADYCKMALELANMKSKN